jgi:hypothetical protein
LFFPQSLIAPKSASSKIRGTPVQLHLKEHFSMSIMGEPI